MTKKMVSILALAIFLIFTGQALAGSYQWKLAHEELPGGFMDSVANEFARLLDKKSNGKIQLHVYPSGTLGTSEDMVELVQHGAVEFNFADAGHLGTQIPQVQVMLLQYLFPQNMDVVMKVLRDGSFMDKLTPKFQEKNLEPLANYTEGWQVWTTNRLIKQPADFKDFKMRTMSSKLLVESYAKYGANPTPVPFSEVYSSLQLKMVDGQENPVFAIYDMKFYEVQDYLIFGYTAPFCLTLVTNSAIFKGLPADIQAIVRAAAKESVAFGFKWQEDFNKSRLDKMLKAKKDLKVVYLTPEEMGKFQALAKQTYDTYVAIGGDGAKEILNALQADITKFSK
ncbi:MAG: C4-dicarboxylate ABC transporter [Deltaproteobacteria bacterium]|nr:MAG: C4-dicarboxylate ABC transporter [Deltaproteobacteria bacterium]